MSVPITARPCTFSAHQVPRLTHRAPAVSGSCRRHRVLCQPCHATPVATEELKGEELEQWKACQSKIEGLGFSPEEATKFLNKAFAWQKGYWGPEKSEPEVPSIAQIDSVVAYLDELGVKDQDLAAAVKQFPQVLGMKVEDRMKPNIEKIEKEFKIQGPAMKNVLKRKPQVLGFNWDCFGDCEGNCPRCWVHF